MFWILLLSTFVSEDAATLAAGALVAHGELGALTGILAVLIGIYVGDLALFAAGRLGRRAFAWARRTEGRDPSGVARSTAGDRASGAQRGWTEARAAAAILASRFLPGTRVAIYVAAGGTGMPARVFARWSLVAVTLWTSLLVGASVAAGRLAASAWPASRLALALVLGLTVVALRLALSLTTTHGRQRLAARASRVRRWGCWRLWPVRSLKLARRIA